jgi:hypothetical protein
MYYPLSEITENLYTSGGEFIDIKNKQLYAGFYFSTSDGKYFTGKTNNNEAVELLKLTTSARSVLYSPPDSYYPFPEENDYQKGFITRYAIKRVNSGPETIKEISKQEYDRISSEPLYSRAEFEWKITGTLLDDDSNPMYSIPGVSTINRLTINNLESKIPGISQVFINYTEFAK